MIQNGEEKKPFKISMVNAFAIPYWKHLSA